MVYEKHKEMAYQKVKTKKKPWETPELVFARTESVRLHTELKFPAVKIAKILNKNPNQIARWLTAAGVYKPLSPKQAARMRQPSLESANRAILSQYLLEISRLKALEKLSEQCPCKECSKLFRPKLRVQEFCCPECRTKFYLRENRSVIVEKASRRFALANKSRVEKLYQTKQPKCAFCNKMIPLSRFYRMNSAKFCSERCSRRAETELRKTDSIKAAAYKKTKTKTYLKRKLNGKNRLEKRKYYQNNFQARMAKNLRNRIRYAFRNQGGEKSASTIELVGTDWETLIKWIVSKFKPGMTKNNCDLWDIDHIIPCKAFDLSKPEQQKACFHYTNLQPLWRIENLKKGAKILPTQLSLLI
jgi:Zn finger protein HypA/HybF involved in hydrogenase expression